MKAVVRITRHQLDADRLSCLKDVFGSDLTVVTQDIPYGDDAIASVQALLATVRADGHEVVALEAQAPFPVLMKLVDRRRDLGVALIRAQFARDESGRAIVTGKDESGRDLLKFSHYEELLRIEFETRPLRSQALNDALKPKS